MADSREIKAVILLSTCFCSCSAPQPSLPLLLPPPPPLSGPPQAPNGQPVWAKCSGRGAGIVQDTAREQLLSGRKGCGASASWAYGSASQATNFGPLLGRRVACLASPSAGWGAFSVALLLETRVPCLGAWHVPLLQEGGMQPGEMLRSPLRPFIQPCRREAPRIPCQLRG